MADYSDLLKDLLQQLETKNIRDPEIRKILQKVEKNIATHIDGQQYAIRLGQNTADVIITNLLDGLEIPDYYKLEDTIMPLLKNDHELVNELAAEIQKSLYEKANLGLNPIKPALEVDRAEDLINAISDAKNITQARNLVDSSLKDLIQHFDDKFIEENAKQEYHVGLHPSIKRILSGGACDWCIGLAGNYSYPDVPKDVYRRHRSCRCLVTYDPGTGRRTDIWSKKQYMGDMDDAEVLERIADAEARDDFWSQQQEKARATIRERIKTGEYKLQIQEQKYLEHVQGTPGYLNTWKTRGVEPSRLLISKEEAQELIDTFSGLGRVRFSTNGHTDYVEYTSWKNYIGEVQINGKWIRTKRFSLHHSKGGTHIVPSNPRGYK